tara:strand:+ start:79 stop:438 length:360 start_codon:yes stop_codon:yes gene_type:complete
MRNFNESKMGSNIVKNREKLYAYYSKKQSHNVQNKWNRTIVERNENRVDRPFIFYEDMNGKLIEVTEVTSNPNNYHWNFDDVVELGLVKCWKKNMTLAEYGNYTGFEESYAGIEEFKEG